MMEITRSLRAGAHFLLLFHQGAAFLSAVAPHRGSSTGRRPSAHAYHEDLADDDLVALPFDGYLDATASNGDSDGDSDSKRGLRLCVVRNGRCVYPLIRHEDDSETDLFLDPRHVDLSIALGEISTWSGVGEQNYYGMGYYGQRPVPSLGGGPGEVHVICLLQNSRQV